MCRFLFFLLNYFKFYDKLRKSRMPLYIPSANSRGEFAIKNKVWEWDFGSYKVRYVTVFYGGYAFHSRIYNRSYSVMLDDAIGYPASDGCLRMLDEDCRYIIDEMPYNTRVVVY